MLFPHLATLLTECGLGSEGYVICGVDRELAGNDEDLRLYCIGSDILDHVLWSDK